MKWDFKGVFEPKFFELLRSRTYSKDLFFKDFTAGIIVGVVAIPLAIAFAIASGVSPQQGLITAIVGGAIISMLGGSHVQIGGPTGAFIVIIAGIISQYGFNGLMIATFMAGVILILMGLLKIGDIIKFMPYPIIVGFTSGIALTIFSTQMKDFFGLTALDGGTLAVGICGEMEVLHRTLLHNQPFCNGNGGLHGGDRISLVEGYESHTGQPDCHNRLYDSRNPIEKSRNRTCDHRERLSRIGRWCCTSASRSSQDRHRRRANADFACLHDSCALCHRKSSFRHGG